MSRLIVIALMLRCRPSIHTRPGPSPIGTAQPYVSCTAISSTKSQSPPPPHPTILHTNWPLLNSQILQKEIRAKSQTSKNQNIELYIEQGIGGVLSVERVVEETRY